MTYSARYDVIDRTNGAMRSMSVRASALAVRRFNMSASNGDFGRGSGCRSTAIISSTIGIVRRSRRFNLDLCSQTARSTAHFTSSGVKANSSSERDNITGTTPVAKQRRGPTLNFVNRAKVNSPERVRAQGVCPRWQPVSRQRFLDVYPSPRGWKNFPAENGCHEREFA